MRQGKPQKFRTNQGRERWLIESVTSEVFAVGDLPKLPSFADRKSYDLLQYYTKEQVTMSVDLAKLLRAKKLCFIRVIDGEVISKTFDPMEMFG